MSATACALTQEEMRVRIEAAGLFASPEMTSGNVRTFTVVKDGKERLWTESKVRNLCGDQRKQTS